MPNDFPMPPFLEGEALPPEEAERGTSNTPRGFSDPEVLARAQETRRRNRENGTAQDMPVDGSAPAKRTYTKRKRDTEGVEAMLMMAGTAIGALVETLTRIPDIADDIALDEQEAKQLAQTGAALAAQYKVELSGKSGAAFAFGSAIAVVTIPRVILVVRKSKERKLNGGNPVS